MLKARIQKTTNKKLFKKLNILLGKSYSLKELDYLVNLLVEEIAYKKNGTINIKLEVIDSETEVLKWYNDNIELNSYLDYIPSNDIDSKLNKDNSLIKLIIKRDLNQDPEVDEEDKLEFFKLYDDSYDFQETTKDKMIFKKLPNIFKFGKKKMDIKDYNSQETLIEEKPSSLEEDFNNQSDNVSAIDVGCEEQEPQFESYQIEEKPNSNSKDEEHLPEQQEMIQEKKELNNIYTLPIKIPSFIPKEPIKKSGETALDDLREDFLYLRAIEREQYRKTLYENIVHSLNQKDSDLNAEFERKIILYKEENELTDNEIENIELEKRNELEKQLDAFRLSLEKNKDTELLLLKEEYDIKLKDKEHALESELDDKIQEKISENENLINNYIINCLQKQDELINLDVKDLTNKFNIEKVEILNLELNKSENELNTKLEEFDKDTFSQLKDKIFEFKQEIIAKQLRHNQKLKLENEQLKLKKTLKQAKQLEDEVEKAKEEAKIREFKYKEEKEKARILDLELNKEKQKYQNKLLIETERENDLKQRELDMLDIKNNKSNITEKKNKENKNNEIKYNKPYFYKGILLILLVCLIIASITGYGIKSFIDMNQANKIENQNKKEELDSLLSKHDYKKAIKLYPNNTNEIVNYAYKNNDVNGLELVIADKDDAQAKIYKGLLEKNPEKTTELYMKNKNKIKLSDSDLEQVGMMMLDDNKVDQAIDINKNLKSKKLGQKIKDYKILSQYKEKKTKQVKEDK